MPDAPALALANLSPHPVFPAPQPRSGRAHPRHDPCPRCGAPLEAREGVREGCRTCLTALCRSEHPAPTGAARRRLLPLHLTIAPRA